MGEDNFLEIGQANEFQLFYQTYRLLHINNLVIFPQLLKPLPIMKSKPHQKMNMKPQRAGFPPAEFRQRHKTISPVIPRPSLNLMYMSTTAKKKQLKNRTRACPSTHVFYCTAASRPESIVAARAQKAASKTWARESLPLAASSASG